MKCLSFNCRGLASASKKLALQRLVEVDTIDIILLQEILGPAEHITRSLQSLVPSWNFVAIDAVGRSGGLAIGYNPRSIRVDASWGGLGFMGINIFSAELSKNLRIVNVYGPCHQSEQFWHHFLNLSILASDHIIIGGVLNFSLGFNESWGSSAQVDAITAHMTNLLDQTNFVDVPMHKPLPTWRKRRVGEAALARRLDRFLMKGLLIQRLHHYKQWVGSRGISDHSPIYLEIHGPHQKPKAPLNSISLGFISADDKARLIELENQKAHILKAREESQRLRSKAIWLKAGDDNTRFFQNYAKRRRVANTIWNLPLPEGGLADSFNKLSHLGTSHFRNLYKCPPDANLADIINVAGHFPRFVNEEDAEELFTPIISGELEGTLKWFKKDKSPGPDGWTIKFYLAFYEILGSDLLKVVEESRVSGSLYHAINSTFIAVIPKSDSPSSFDDYRPISLCNCLYKIISKIIANRLKPILSRHIAPQQFAFLEARQIMKP
eukprot:PITA_14091